MHGSRVTQKYQKSITTIKASKAGHMPRFYLRHASKAIPKTAPLTSE